MRTLNLLLALGIVLAGPASATEPKAAGSKVAESKTAESKTAENVAPPFDGVSGAFFALSVGDMDASVRWYSEKLGLKTMMRVPKQNRAGVAVLEGGGLIVELIQNDQAVPLSKVAPSVSEPGLVHGIFKVGVVVSDFEQVMGRLRERKVQIVAGPFPATQSQRANVLVRDNSGNLIQFFGK